MPPNSPQWAIGSAGLKRSDNRPLLRQRNGASLTTGLQLQPDERRGSQQWQRVDRALAKARAQFSIASSEEDWQQIGLLCREVLISLAQAVYDPEIHTTVTEDGKPISTTDANRMIEAYVGQAFPGSSYQEVRVHARASLALALNLQHRRTATRQLAALCIEATSSAVAVISIIANGEK